MIFLYVCLTLVFAISWIAAFGWMKDEGIFPLQSPIPADIIRFAITPILIAALLVYGVTTKVLDLFCGDL